MEEAARKEPAIEIVSSQNHFARLKPNGMQDQVKCQANEKLKSEN